MQAKCSAKFIYLLSRQYPELSAYEIGSRCSSYAVSNLVVTEKYVDPEGLAYTKTAFEVICHAPVEKIVQEMVCTDINIHYNGCFALRMHKADNSVSCLSEKELAATVWKSIEKPRVCLKNPETKFWIITCEHYAYFCKEIWENKEKFQDRKTSLRPEPHPTSLDPRLARAMVNILNKSSFIDPFCGSGGILIEGGLAGCRVTGMDIDPVMIRRAEINLKHYHIMDYVLQTGDATALKGCFEGIITELPYGRNSRLKNMEYTYSEFMQKAKKCTNKLIVSFPDMDSYRDFARGWTIVKEFQIYLHKGLSKRMLVLCH